jgi:hypothetical protein
MTQETFEILTTATEKRYRQANENDEKSSFYCMKDNVPTDIAQTLKDIVYNKNNGFDIPYMMLDDALNILYSIELDRILDDSFDIYNYDGDIGSVYTSDQLEYLNLNTQQEISDIMREYDLTDIASACSYWYDQEVRDMVNEIIDYIKNN